MNANKFIHFLLAIFILVGCKKQPSPEPEYLLERDNKAHVTANITHAKIYEAKEYLSINGLPANGLDSIYGIFHCLRPCEPGYHYLHPSVFYNYEAPKPMDQNNYKGLGSDVKMFINSQDTSDFILEFDFNAAHITIHSKRGFPNCIFDSKGRNFAGDYALNRPYKIEYSNSNTNTDSIYDCNPRMHSIPLTSTLVSLHTYMPLKMWPKPNDYGILFRNFSYIKIDGKLFIIVNDAPYYYQAIK